jgi:hypothetical protein
VIRCKEYLDGWLTSERQLPESLVIGDSKAAEPQLLGHVDGVPVIASAAVEPGKLYAIGSLAEVERVITTTIQPDSGRLGAVAKENAPARLARKTRRKA